MVSIGQHFVTTKVVHLPKMTETSLITESDEADLITKSDQAVRAVHSCNSWFNPTFIGFEETSLYWSVEFSSVFSLLFIGYHQSANFV